jgi:hypothetical protein
VPCQQRQTVGFCAVPGGFTGPSRGGVFGALAALACASSLAAILAAAPARADGPVVAPTAEAAVLDPDATAAADEETDAAADADVAAAADADAVAAADADADAAADGSATLSLEPPPPPEQRASLFGGELHFQIVLPVADALCPTGESCLLNGGFGIGGSIERRWSFGGALLLGYDLALLDAGGIYEVSTLQTVRIGVKWVVPLDRVLKPYVELAVGALLFGDTFGVATAGGALQVGVGGELELTEALALTGGLVFRGFTTGAFISTTDRVPRGRDPGANLALLFQVGILFMDDPVP